MTKLVFFSFLKKNIPPSTVQLGSSLWNMYTSYKMYTIFPASAGVNHKYSLLFTLIMQEFYDLR